MTIEKLTAYRDHLIAWQSEADTLNHIDPRTRDQEDRLADLRSAIDTYEQALEDVPEISQQPWVARALKAA